MQLRLTAQFAEPHLASGVLAYDPAAHALFLRLKILFEICLKWRHIFRQFVDRNQLIGIRGAIAFKVLSFLKENFPLLPFENLRVVQIKARSEIGSRGVASDVESRFVGHIQKIIEIFVATEIPDDVKRLDQVGGHIFIRLREDASQSEVVDLAAIRGWKGKPLHIEKKPVRIKQPEQILSLNSLEQVRLSKALQFKRHISHTLS